MESSFQIGTVVKARMFRRWRRKGEQKAVGDGGAVGRGSVKMDFGMD